MTWFSLLLPVAPGSLLVTSGYLIAFSDYIIATRKQTKTEIRVIHAAEHTNKKIEEMKVLDNCKLNIY